MTSSKTLSSPASVKTKLSEKSAESMERKQVTPFHHAEARLKWARSTRNAKSDNIRTCKAKVQSLKDELRAKKIMIKLMKLQRDEAQRRVDVERKEYRNELYNDEQGDMHQLDERYLTSLSSDVGRYEEDDSSLYVPSEPEQEKKKKSPASRALFRSPRKAMNQASLKLASRNFPGGKNAQPPKTPLQASSQPSTSQTTPFTVKPKSLLHFLTTDESTGEVKPVDLETHNVITPLLRCEVGASIVHNPHKLLNKALPWKIDEDLLLHHLSEMPGAMYDTDAERWIHCPEIVPGPAGVVESLLTGFIEHVIANVQEFIEYYQPELVPKRSQKRIWSAVYAKKIVPDGECHRKPDIVLLDPSIKPFRRYINPRLLTIWYQILSIIEIKTKATIGECIYQLSQSARLMFRHQPHRQFIICAFLIGEKITLVIFDRSGAVKSTSYDIHKNPIAFVRIVTLIFLADMTTLGFDETINLKNGEGDLYVGKNRYIIDDIIYVEGVIRGRGTVCYNVHPPGNKKLKYVVKDSWVDVSRRLREHHVLKRLANVKGIVRLVDHAVVPSKKLGKRANTSFFRRPLVYRITVSGKRGKQWAWKKDLYDVVEMREHHRIVISPYVKKVVDFPHLVGFTTIMRDVAISTGDMHDKGIVHRDLNLRNIAYEEKSNGEVGGVVLDFDVCKEVLSPDPAAIGHRTATLAFMPFDALDVTMASPVPHTVLHDLESLFYVMIWICTTQRGPNNAWRVFDYSSSEIFLWNADDGFKKGLKSCWNAKSNIIHNDNHFNTLVLGNIDPYFKSIAWCLEELREVLFPRPPPPPPRTSMTDYIQSIHNSAKRQKQTLEPSPMPREIPKPPKRDVKEVVQKFIEVLKAAVLYTEGLPEPPISPLGPGADFGEEIELEEEEETDQPELQCARLMDTECLYEEEATDIEAELDSEEEPEDSEDDAESTDDEV
ncbi:hypothetical protein SCHPADRAFT_896216 [Schizopora paradoxa]|uniref:Fungal-type protein kinase domain-containing protein n=1 Tax=Schizopora paradoxa TaxID=27342 RepID=A0A0H2R1B1_9AGAM|nr:hypothetical protein SCHPADRAFT_896216 [Schizopora paradoxa]